VMPEGLQPPQAHCSYPPMQPCLPSLAASPATAASGPWPPRPGCLANCGEENRAEKGHCAFHQLAFCFGGPFLFRMWHIQGVTDRISVLYTSASGKQNPWRFMVAAAPSALESSSIVQVEIPTLQIGYRTQRTSAKSMATPK